MGRCHAKWKESDLLALWLEQVPLNTPLAASPGTLVRVREKGRRNPDSGPDLCDALLDIGGRLIRGDIEAHLCADDWYAHGHHLDPAYNRVILHIVAGDPRPGGSARCQNGREVLQLSLRMKQQGSTADDCALRREDDRTRFKVIERAGDDRMEIKINRYVEQRHDDSWNQILYNALLESLGYSKNKIPFRELGRRVPVELLLAAIRFDPPDRALCKCQAVLFGAAGLLSQTVLSRRPVDRELSSYLDTLRALWLDFPARNRIEPLAPGAWKYFRLRPYNFPARRIAAAAALLVRLSGRGFFQALCTPVRSDPGRLKKTQHELEQLLMLPAGGIWRDHFALWLGPKTGRGENHLIGRDRARVMLVDVVYPVLIGYAREIHDGRLQCQARQLALVCPRTPDNEITRKMQRRVFGTDKIPSFRARQQQGLIHLYSQICLTGPCRRCLAS